MRLRPIVERVVVYGAFALFLNYFGLPLGGHVSLTCMKNNLTKKKIQQVCKADSHLEDIAANIKKDSELLSILKSADALSSKWLKHGTPKLFGEGKQALEKGEADCSYFSTFTYSNFLYLADKLEKPELKDKVRLCVGYLVDEKKELYGGHAWLQVYLDNEWKDYEATYDAIKDEDIDFKNLDATFPDFIVFDCEGYKRFNYIQFEKGKLVKHINISGSFEHDVELKDLLWLMGKDVYQHFKDNKKKMESDSDDSSITHYMQVLP